jgi:perosamine synthetase
MITSDDADLIKKCREMTWFGVSSTWSRANGLNGKPGYSWDYDVNTIGYKYYMTDLMAAICLVQMKKLPQHLKFRRHVQKRYNTELNKRIERPPFSETVQYYCARVDKNIRGELIDYLSEKKIHTSVHFKPLYLYQPLKQDRRYPIMDVEWLRFITLPCHNAMTENDIDYVIYWVNNFFEKLQD